MSEKITKLFKGEEKGITRRSFLKSVGGVAIGTTLAGAGLTGFARAAQEKKLNLIWTQPYAPMVKEIKEIISEYEELNPGVTISLDVMRWEDALAKISAGVAAGAPPDLIYVIPAQIFTLQAEGWLQPVTDILEELGGDEFFLPLPAYVKVDGEHWEVPSGSMTLHITYRKDLFEWEGLEEPKTWDKLLEAAKVLTEPEKGRYGIALPFSRSYALGVFFTTMLWCNEGHILDKEGNVVFNSPECHETLEFMKKIYDYTPPGASEYSWLQLGEAYAMGKVAMTEYSGMHPWARAIRAGEKDIEYGTDITSIPVSSPELEPKLRWVNVEFGLMKGTKNRELAKDFIKYFMKTENLIEYYHDTDPTYQVPGEKPVIESKEYWKQPLIEAHKDVLEKYIDLGKYGARIGMEYPGVLTRAATIANQKLVIADCVQEVVLKGVSPEEAAAKAANKITEIAEGL